MRQSRLNELKMHVGTYGLRRCMHGHKGDDNENLGLPLIYLGYRLPKGIVGGGGSLICGKDGLVLW